MSTQIFTTGPVVHDSVPVGSDFVGGAEPLPARPTGAGQAVPGSDFAGGAAPLTAAAGAGEREERRRPA
jgi:hypothetical protein